MNQAEAEEAARKKMQQQEETFVELNDKMDEYQDMQALCDRIPENYDKASFKTLCKNVLRTRRQLLLDLSDRLEEQQQ